MLCRSYKPKYHCGGAETQHFMTLDELNSREAPTIGSNVFIGAHAMILGNITVGDNAKNGAAAVVLNDVPAGCVTVGVPARILNNGERSH